MKSPHQTRWPCNYTHAISCELLVGILRIYIAKALMAIIKECFLSVVTDLSSGTNSQFTLLQPVGSDFVYYSIWLECCNNYAPAAHPAFQIAFRKQCWSQLFGDMPVINRPLYNFTLVAHSKVHNATFYWRSLRTSDALCRDSALMKAFLSHADIYQNKKRCA